MAATEKVWDYIQLKMPVWDKNTLLDGRLIEANPTPNATMNVAVRTNIWGTEKWHINGIPMSALRYVPAGYSPQRALKDGFLIIDPYDPRSIGYRLFYKEPMTQLQDVKDRLDRAITEAGILKKQSGRITVDGLLHELIWVREGVGQLEKPTTKSTNETFPGMGKFTGKDLGEHRL